MKFLPALSALALVAGLGTAPALAQPHPMMGGNMAMNHQCGRHMTWVRGYRRRDGRWVPGHCRAMHR